MMSKWSISLVAFGLLFLAIFLFCPAIYAQEYHPDCEKGDGVFRNMTFLKVPLGHTAIYFNSKSTSTDPKEEITESDLQHSVIQAYWLELFGESPPANPASWETFLNNKEYWGSKE